MLDQQMMYNSDVNIRYRLETEMIYDDGALLGQTLLTSSLLGLNNEHGV